MTGRMIPVPESALRAVAVWWRGGGGVRNESLDALVACLPEPEPTFTDEEALAFYRAAFSSGQGGDFAIKHGGGFLNRLAKAGWTAPKALCPPPSPALVELVEAATKVANAYPLHTDDLNRLRAAVAAHDEQEGTP